MRLQNVDRLDGIPDVAHVVVRLDARARIDDQIRKEIFFGTDDFRAHARLCALQQGFLPERLHVSRQLTFDVLDAFSHRQPEPSDDVRRVNLIPHQLIRPLQKLRGENHHRSRSISHFLILQLGELDQDLRRRVFNL